MEDVPPSYESAVNRDVWTVIAPWIASNDLCAASLVSRRWHSIFAPFLWGDPASHFGTENDAVYVALTRFKRTLKKARLDVRQLTHTFHLPPALSEIYGGPNSFWLRDVLDNLPNLQSLLVSRLPFFDHQSLVALRQRATVRQQDDEAGTVQYGLKLLMATKEPNSTSIGLTEAISHFPQLVYLDLSHTTPARDPSVLLSLSALQDLQVLKLRGVGLRDSEAEVLANAIRTQVRVLDIRDNVLTDMAVRSLMQACFVPAEMTSNAVESHHRFGDWPQGLPPGPDFLSLDALRNEDLDQQILRQLTKPLTGRLAFENIPHRGITHLYVSGNRLSVEGLSSLLQSKRLHVLDGGTVDTAKIVTRMRSSSSPNRHIDEMRFPGAEKLVPVLIHGAGERLSYLRVNHAVVTAKPDIQDTHSPSAPSKRTASTELPLREARAELPASTELPLREARAELPASTHLPVELAASEQIFELSAEPPQPRAELPGDLIHFALSPPIGDPPAGTGEDATVLTPRRGSGAYAPEPVICEAESSVYQMGSHDSGQSENERVILDATGSRLSSRRSAAKTTPNSLVMPTSIMEEARQHSPSVHLSPSLARQQQINELLAKRPTHSPTTPTTLHGSVSRDAENTELPALHPSNLPHLRTLILTDVPCEVSASSSLPATIIAFIAACADESFLSRLLAKTDYSLPPGRSRLAAERDHAKALFALETLVLEMSKGPRRITQGSTSQPRTSWRHSRQRNSFTKSSTGDRDSEALWSAAEGDFSFFGEEGEAEEEMGLYKTDMGKYGFLSSGADGLIPVYGEEDEMTRQATTDVQSTATRTGGTQELSALLPSGLPDQGSRMDGRVTMATLSRPPATSLEDHELEEMVDVIATVSSFRKAKKAEYESALTVWQQVRERNYTLGSPKTPTCTSSASAASLADYPFVPGYWDGEIKVIRPSPVHPAAVSSRSREQDQFPRSPGLANTLQQAPLSPTIFPDYAYASSNRAPLSSPRRADSRSAAAVARDREVEEEGTQTVDFYGNRFEGGYLYP